MSKKDIGEGAPLGETLPRLGTFWCIVSVPILRRRELGSTPRTMAQLPLASHPTTAPLHRSVQQMNSSTKCRSGGGGFSIHSSAGWRHGHGGTISGSMQGKDRQLSLPQHCLVDALGLYRAAPILELHHVLQGCWEQEKVASVQELRVQGASPEAVALKIEQGNTQRTFLFSRLFCFPG